jgi:peptidyl-prolyl cis-trans isomerase B (cyclophilin B)
MNPTVLLKMKSSHTILIELYPEAAFNTVNSFIHSVMMGFYNHHAIERIVPGNWIDLSYKAFGRSEAQYLIPYESELHPEIEPLESRAGSVCMGGYGDLGLAGSEFFITLRSCPEHRGIYPVFGQVTEGLEEVERLGKVRTRPVKNYPTPGVEVNEPLNPEIIEKVELDLQGFGYQEPIRVEHSKLPECWTMDW